VRADLACPRREEVAYLAGVSVTWYAWLKQGRDITRSWQVLERLEIHEGHRSLSLIQSSTRQDHEESRLVAILLVAAPLSSRGQRSVN
jgi:hypothetical protein